MQSKSTNTVGEETIKDKLSDAARVLAQYGGSKGGRISAQNLTHKQRKARARKAGIASGEARRKNKKHKGA